MREFAKADPVNQAESADLNQWEYRIWVFIQQAKKDTKR